MSGNLAELSDVAVELGLTNQTAMSENQRTRAGLLLSRVSDLVSQEAQRDFVPGTSTVRLKVQFNHHRRRKGFVRLTERPASVLSVINDADVTIVDFTVRQFEVHFKNITMWDRIWDQYELTDTEADFVTVTYTHNEPIPAGVRQAVAGIVARYIALSDATGSTVQPSASSLQAGGGIVTYRAGFADWVTQSVQLTAQDKAAARSYRYPASLPIVVGT